MCIFFSKTLFFSFLCRFPMIITFLILYCFGIPLYFLYKLFINRDALHSISHSKHDELAFEMGGLYLMYEANYWWFQIIIMLYKMIMTGALSVITPGSPIQQLIACFVAQGYMLICLRTQPFKLDVDDLASTVSNVVMVVTLFLCLCTLINFLFLLLNRLKLL